MKIRATLGAFVAAMALSAHADPLVITTVAGGGVGDSGAALDAAISLPVAVAFDAAGNLYFSDQGFNRIRRVARDTGIITTFVGTGDAGFAGDGGNAKSAQLSSPTALAFDRDGNLYVADGGNDRVRRIDASGTITTIAGGGDGTIGAHDIGDGVIATLAVLSNPSALAMDASGTHLYVADQYHNRIRRIDLASGLIQTVAGNGAMGYAGDGGPATAARLNGPAAIAAAISGDLYIADQNNLRVRKVDGRSGVITTVAGGPRLRDLSQGSQSTSGLNFTVTAIPFAGDGGPATTAPLLRPDGLALDDAGNLYVADGVLARVLRVDAVTGVINNFAGIGAADYSGDGGPASAAGLGFPMGLAFDPAGNLLVADRDNNTVRSISTSGTISRVAGNGDPNFTGEGGNPLDAALNSPVSMAFTSVGELVIADTGNARLRKIGSDGAIRTIAGGGYDAAFVCSRHPTDAASLRLLIIESIAVDASDNVYVPLGIESVVCTLGVNGVMYPFAGAFAGQFSEYYGFNGDGFPALEASFLSPFAVLRSRSGDVFITDQNASRVRRVAHDGIITTYAGVGVAGFTGDGGLAARSHLSGPTFLAADDHALYVADTDNQRV